MTRRIDLNDVRLLVQVVKHGSYAAAARETGYPKSTISQRIMQLERTVGTALLRRTSRSFSLTEAGERVLPHARAIEDLAQRVERSLMDGGQGLRGTLRVAASQAIAQLALFPILPRFLAAHPRVSVKVEASNRIVDLVAEGYDLALRGSIASPKDSTLLQRVIVRSQWVLAASPAWIERNGSPATPDDIPVDQALCFLHQPDSSSWTLSKDGREIRVGLAPRLVSDDMLALKSSALAGGGLACLPGAVVAPEFAAGSLVEVLPEWRCHSSAISIVTPPRGQSSRLAGAFSEFLAAELPPMMRYDPPAKGAQPS